MKISFVNFLQKVVMSDGVGRLFDFNTTLPLMGLQFITLTTTLTFLFYKPLNQIFKKRKKKNIYKLSRALSNLSTSYYLTNLYRKMSQDRREEIDNLKAVHKEKTNKYAALKINAVRQKYKKIIVRINRNLRHDLNRYLFKFVSNQLEDSMENCAKQNYHLYSQVQHLIENTTWKLTQVLDVDPQMHNNEDFESERLSIAEGEVLNPYLLPEYNIPKNRDWSPNEFYLKQHISLIRIPTRPPFLDDAFHFRKRYFI